MWHVRFLIRATLPRAPHAVPVRRVGPEGELPGTEPLADLGLPVAGVAAERPRRRELAELVADHLLGDEHGHVLAAVVDRNRVPDHLREDRRRPRPGADHPLLVGRVHRLDAAHQPLLDERALLGAAAHYLLSFPRRRPRTISLSEAL